MKSHFKDILAHNNWANERFLEKLEDHKVSDPRVIKIFSHVVSAQVVWLLRIQGLPTSPFPLWESYKLRELRSMIEESARNWKNYIDTHKFETFEEMIFYTDSKGEKHESTIRQIIAQVVSHASYHRGQLAVLLRDLDIEPPQTDYIYYKWR